MLDSAAAVAAQRRHSQALLDELVATTWYERFGKGGWQTEALTSLCDCVSGATPAKADPENWLREVPWFSAKDLKTPNLVNSIDRISRSVVDRGALRVFPAGTVVMVVRGMILSHTIPVCTLRVPATINQDLKALVPRRAVDPDFLAVSLRSQSRLVLQLVSAAAHGTARLDKSALDAIRLPLPPIDEQRGFGSFVQRVGARQDSVDHGRRVLKELVASLQHRAFTGAL